MLTIFESCGAQRHCALAEPEYAQLQGTTMTWGAAYFAGKLRLQMTLVERGTPALPARRARGARPCVAPLLRLLWFGTDGVIEHCMMRPLARWAASEVGTKGVSCMLCVREGRPGSFVRKVQSAPAKPKLVVRSVRGRAWPAEGCLSPCAVRRRECERVLPGHLRGCCCLVISEGGGKHQAARVLVASSGLRCVCSVLCLRGDWCARRRAMLSWRVCSVLRLQDARRMAALTWHGVLF